ncbi:hypothetical protein KAJ27_25555 [bacterium]|nr:hypothetical protein [bacterium]
MKKYVFIILTIVVFSGLLTASQGEIANLIKKLDQLDSSLYDVEFKLDGLYKERMEYDGAGGWFNGIFHKKAKKKLEKKMKEAETGVSSTYGEMQQIRKTIQKKIYAVAFEYEKSGDYQSAIEWYLKLAQITNNVKFRIGSCYKKAKDYSKALKWFFELPRDDNNLYEIADCYELWNKPKDAFQWYMDVLKQFNNTDIELRALNKLETMEYPGKAADYPQYKRFVSDTYVLKAFMNFQPNMALAKQDFLKASKYFKEYSNLKSDRVAGESIVMRYRHKWEEAMQILEEQRYHAEDYYQNKLDHAQREYDYACQEYDDGLRQAENDYHYELQELKRQHNYYRQEAEQYKKEGRTPEEIASAVKWAEHYKREHRNLQQPYAHERFVQDSVSYEREERESANAEYQRIVRNRRQIIDDYLRPYRSRVNESNKRFKTIEMLYQQAF